MFLYQFFKMIAGELKVEFRSVHEHTDNPGAHATDRPAAFIRCPERSFQIATHEQAGVQPFVHLCQVRDPRDILVSEYYSLGWRHSDEHWSDEEKQRREQIQQMSIDEYVLEEPRFSKYPLRDRFQPLIDYANSPMVHVVKYETMVTEFETWLRGVLPILKLDDEKSVRYFTRMYKNEFVRDDHSTSHKRNVAPGDHRAKLSQTTIAQLNRRFENVLDMLDYSP